MEHLYGQAPSAMALNNKALSFTTFSMTMLSVTVEKADTLYDINLMLYTIMPNDVAAFASLTHKY